MPDIRRLLNDLAAAEADLLAARFLAPCVPGGRVRTRVAGLVYTFAARPRDFEGWGIFQPESPDAARCVEEAGLPLVMEYLRRLPAIRLRLAHVLKCKTWLAYPVNEADLRQRTARRGAGSDSVGPLPIHLVSDGGAFEAVVARWDGGAWWFDTVDRRADPTIAERLLDALRQVTLPEALSFKGCTPEMRAVYDLAAQQEPAFQPLMRPRRDEARLREALRLGGGALREAHDRGDYWLVEWTTRDGERHTSAIGKGDLTVLGAGICLSGEDEKFDLQSLVGVVAGREEG